MTSDNQTANIGRASAGGTVLVVGATGSAGSAITAAFRQNTSMCVLTLARSARRDSCDSVAADLLDINGLLSARDRLRAVTHLVFAARLTDAAGHEDRDTNGLALSNLLCAMQGSASRLCRIVLIHGTKFYGSHLGRYLVPAVETDTASEKHFYHVQQDIAERHAQKYNAQWSSLRPHTVFGYSPQPRHNLLLLIALYAAMCVHEGHPLHFPGSPERFSLPTAATDANLLSNATIWAATADAAANQAFNVTNGDALVWRSLWPQLCEQFGAASAGVERVRLATSMPAKAGLWQDMVRAHGLAPTAWPDAADWAYADTILGAARVDIISTAKLAAAGFIQAIDTHRSIIEIMQRLRTERIIP